MGLRQYARVAVVGTILLMCVFTVRVFYTSNAMSTVSSENNYYMDSSEGLSDYILQRNNISRLLNLKQKIIGQMECEVKIYISQMYFNYCFFLQSIVDSKIDENLCKWSDS